MTGYTSMLVEKDMNFQQFAMCCARAMGACVMMRDDPLDAPIPEEFKPDNYHAEKLKKSMERLKFLNEIPVKDRVKWAENAKIAAIEKERQLSEKLINEKKVAINKCQAMLNEVTKWNPPTAEHTGFKNFMIDQLRTTIKHESGYEEYRNEFEINIRKMTPEQFYQAELDEAQRDCEYHRKHLDEEVEVTKNRNAWIKALRESLKG